MAEKELEMSPVNVPAQKHGHAHDAAAKGTPHEHAKAIGARKERAMRPGEVAVTSINGQATDMHVNSFQHNSAAALHGWAEHEHHEAKPIDLSLDDYKKALLAASDPVVRLAVGIDRDVPNGQKQVRVKGAKGDALNLKKLDLSTYDLANAGVSFTADYEPHPGALSPHAAHVKNADAAKPAAKSTDDPHLFAKA